MKRKWVVNSILIILLLTGFFLIYVLWPKEEKLPVLDKVDSFTLQAIDGQEYSSDNGKVKLLTFFYTKCPDICPLTMIDFQKLQAELQNKDLFGKHVELVAVTLDPVNDTTEGIKSYSQSFGADYDGWKFLRGSEDETRNIADLYHMKYKKLKGDFIAHNTTMFLIDQDQQIRGLFDMANQNKAVNIEEIVAAMEVLIEDE